MKFAIAVVLACLGVLPAWAGTLAPGDYRFELAVDGRGRSYFVHVPRQGAAQALPVMIMLHGGGGNARQFRHDAELDAAADRDGYIAVYPNGSGGLRDSLLTWNAGTCCGYAMQHGINDVHFVAAMLDDLGRRANIDARRIYAAGHSNGGMMALRLGAELPERIAAVASMAGAYMPGMSAARAVPVLHIHSVDDPRALYAGGLGPPFPLTGHREQHVPVADALAAWARRDGCDPLLLERESRTLDGHTARLLVYGHCRDGTEVAHWKLTGAGHGWAGSRPVREGLIGPGTHVVDASTEIWRFVSRFTLPD
ncbi:MAG TPA: alpha/beta fold hydrolase [Rhodocyclaceae bacterium]|nr:alpha/beta fold hydrolase [Rhodocyclaceae bacterium]